MVQLSPGVLTREKDFSAYVAAFSTSNLGLAGTASRGPEEVTLITSIPNLIETFGAPTQNSYGLMAAIQYLQQGNQLYYRRVANGSTKATATVKAKSEEIPTLVLESPYAGEYDIKVRIFDVDEPTKTFSMELTYDGQVVQLANEVCMDPETEDYVYVEDALNKQFVRVFDELDGANSKLPAEGTYVLAGGTVGQKVTKQQMVQALNDFIDSDTIHINMLAAPGWAEADVVTKLIQVCEGRADCLGLIDPPFGLQLSDIIKWHNGTLGGADDPGQALNTSYAALYWSWLKVYNEYTGKDMWIPPSGFIAGVIALTDRESEAWFAPAGFRRGRLSAPKAVEFNPDLGSRDAMYGNKNAVNPIVNFAVDGITVWGQRTLQRRATALDRVNVRRLLLTIRRAVADSTTYFTFEQNDEFTWNEWVDLITPFMESIKARRGVYDYKVIMDSTTVTPFNIDRNEMPGKIMIKPTKSAEFITIDFAIMSTGASFDE